MSLNVTKKGNKEYLYFTVDGSSKLYLGTSDKPNKGRIEEAINQMNSKIIKYEKEVQKLKGYVQEEIQEFNIVYRLVAFDLDGVIFDKPWRLDTSSDKVAVSTWNILFQNLDLYKIHELLREKFEKGEFKTYLDWTEAACGAIKALHVLNRQTFEKMIEERPFVQGATDVFRVLHRNNIKTATISGSFDLLAQRAKRALGGIDHIYVHAKLHFDGDGFLESWKLQPTDYGDKVEWIEQITKSEGIPLSECAYIGDDVNDIEAFKKVGLSIAFNSNKSKVNQAAKVVIENRDLKSILPHLCVRK